MRRRAAASLAVLTVLVAGVAPAMWVQMAGQSRVRHSADAVTPAPVALVLGAGLQPGGSPSTYLWRRLAAAADLYQRGTVRAILVSGARRGAHYDEPAAMRAWLVGRGIPAGVIVEDPYGLDTWNSCTRARAVYGVQQAVVVTQDYHLRRSLFACAQAGIDAQGLGVSAASVSWAQGGWYHVREVLASAKAGWDAVRHRGPGGPLMPDGAVTSILNQPDAVPD